MCSESIDVELSNKLAEELKLEGSMDEGMEIPLSIQEYLQKGPFKVPLPMNSINCEVIDIPGSDEVTLTLNYGSET